MILTSLAAGNAVSSVAPLGASKSSLPTAAMTAMQMASPDHVK